MVGIRAITAAVALAAVIAQAPSARAQTPGPPPEARELVVGTKVAPPFAMKAEDGAWRGISIDLWQRIANQTHLRYRFQETTLKGLIDGVAEGSLDAAVAALTVTGSRHRVVDFTQPFLQRRARHCGAIGRGYHLVANHTQRVFPRFFPRCRSAIRHLAFCRRRPLAHRAPS